LSSLSLRWFLRFCVLGVILKQVVGDEFDGIFRALPSHFGKGLQHNRDDCLVKVGSDLKSARAVLLRLS